MNSTSSGPRPPEPDPSAPRPPAPSPSAPRPSPPPSAPPHQADWDDDWEEQAYTD